MDVNDLMNVFELHKEELAHILDDCKEGPSELVLLASKMGPLLDNLSLLKAELSSSISGAEASTKPETEGDIPSEE